LELSVRIGMSACLTGQEVRYNGGHLNDSFLMGTFSKYVEWVPVCPEVEIGMGVPREEIRLTGDPAHPKLVGSRSGQDHTVKMLNWAGKRVTELADENLDGFIFAKESPSCGLYRVRVYPDNNPVPVRNGTGMFARALTENMWDLPVEENGRLHDSRIRENFIEQIFTRRRWRRMLETDPSPNGLVKFHTAHKLTFMAHSNKYYREAGRLVAVAGTLPWKALIAQYSMLMVDCLRCIATPKRNTNVLLHLMGYLKRDLSTEDKQEMLDLIEAYRMENLPLIVPLTLLRHHLNRNPVPEWVNQQVFLSPYPEELMLRNHV